MKIKSIVTTAALAALALAGSIQAATFNLGSGNGTQNALNSNNFGNSYTFGPVSTVSVTASSFSNNGSGFVAANVGQYSGGLGVSNTTEGLNPGSPNHAVDNYPGNVDYLRFTFTSSVTLTKVAFGWYQTDDDFKYWIGTNLTTASLLSGGTSVNGTGAGSTGYGISGSGNTLWIAAQPDTNAWGFSYFKVNTLTFTTGSDTTVSTPDAGSTVALLGLALAGLAFAKRRFGA